VQLYGTTLLQMAKACLLKELVIQGEVGLWVASDRYITSNALVSLLQQCPHLISIGIMIVMDWPSED
jgi:hypothetical protein